MWCILYKMRVLIRNILCTRYLKIIASYEASRCNVTDDLQTDTCPCKEKSQYAYLI